VVSLALLAAAGMAAALSTKYYDKWCPRCPVLQPAVRSAVAMLRLFFHAYFVNGYDAFVLLDDGAAAGPGEKGAGLNAGSLRGYEVVDAAKAAAEAACPGAVSSADVLALDARSPPSPPPALGLMPDPSSEPTSPRSLTAPATPPPCDCCLPTARHSRRPTPPRPSCSRTDWRAMPRVPRRGRAGRLRHQGRRGGRNCGGERREGEERRDLADKWTPPPRGVHISETV